ncbi:MAG: hypothetical protein NE330_04530 [Lentisphaeraceae bacterium]|nr:hypothetical protein [Lentisphaeraceae bacterium]
MNIAAVAGAEATQQVNSTDNVFGDQFIGKDGFLKLLITQMQNQDPLEPMSNEDFAAQLAQFSSLEQMQNLNESFTDLMDLNKVSTTGSLIGKNVVYQDGETGQNVTGNIDRVIIKSDGTYFKIDGKEISSDQIKEIAQQQTQTATQPTL